MERGVIQFNLGTKCLVRLCVSLHSLRKHYSGPVTILNGGNDGGICGKISAAFGAEVVEIPVVQRRKNTAYTTKSGLWKFSPYSTSVLVDSDTVFMASPEPLLEFAESGVLLTRFSNWISTGPLISGRIIKWRGIIADGINVEGLIKASLEAPHAAINTGVVGFNLERGKSFLRDWDTLTCAGWRCPLGDELAAQLLTRKHEHVLVGTQWNFSPLYSKGVEPKIVHHHGHKELRPEAIGYWLPHFKECWQEDKSGIRGWIPTEERERYLEYL